MIRDRRLSAAVLLLGASLAAGCTTLPSSGPTGSDVLHSARRGDVPFNIVDVNAATVAALNARAAQHHGTLTMFAGTGRNDTLGPGDVLQISLYEVGASLFAAGQSLAGAVEYDPSAKAVNFPPVTVDRDGGIVLPFIGRLQVAGHTTAEVQRMVAEGLRGKSQNPQALVAVTKNISNRVFLGGDVHQPGPVELTLGSERLSDLISIGQGTTAAVDDSIVRLFRNGRVGEERLSDLVPGSPEDVVLKGGDRVLVLHRPRSFTVFGATSKVSQVSFETNAVSLAEAIARISGPLDNQANPKAVFLFRYTASGIPGGAEQPTLYRINLDNAASYLLATRFAMQDKDVIYIANAASNQPAKLFGIINQLFGPFVTARAVTR